jgi:hypothetical protein
MPLWHIASSFNLGYGARVVNYTKKGFMKLAPVANLIKLFGVINAAISILP